MKSARSKIKLLFYRMLWLLRDKEDRKPWDQVISCINHKDHTYDGEIVKIHGIKFQKCSHYGCNVYNPLD